MKESFTDENQLTEIWEFEGTKLTTCFKGMIDVGIFKFESSLE